MGLDVFFYLAKKTRKRENYTSSYDFICDLEEDEDKRVLSILKDKVNTSFKEMRKAKKDWEEKNPDKTFSMDCIINLYRMFYHDMAEFFPYDFERKPIEHPESIKAIEEWAKKEYKYFSKPEAAYFRKVNCIYRYFSDRLENEHCIVEKEDVIDIMNRAIRILSTKDMELAEELLPTQSGFFFGSTEYDEWYFCDMVEILKEFSKLLKEWEDDDICYVYMSW
jgi:hypothetical protein